MSDSGISWAICKSAPHSRQITMPVPHHSVFYRPDALPGAQPTASKHWRHITEQEIEHQLLCLTRASIVHFQCRLRAFSHDLCPSQSKMVHKTTSGSSCDRTFRLCMHGFSTIELISWRLSASLYQFKQLTISAFGVSQFCQSSTVWP